MLLWGAFGRKFRTVTVQPSFQIFRARIKSQRSIIYYLIIIIIIVILFCHSSNLTSKISFLFQIQLYGYNTDLYSNMSEAQMKSQGIVGVSLMVQVSSVKRFSSSVFFFRCWRFVNNCLFVAPFRSDKRRIRNFKWSPTSSANSCTKVSALR